MTRLINPDQPYLLNTCDISVKLKTAENLLEIVLGEIVYTVEVLKVKVVAWCTDASGDSAKIWCLLVQKIPQIIVDDCWVRQVNLVVSNIFKIQGLFSKIIDDALEVVKWFNNHSCALGILNAEQLKISLKVKSLVIPVLTCWTLHYLSV
ncbi:hypothetical protein EV424DRAFT_1334062 [Suillus variegatus]|nr:hypothetical protein EV424DRAFT_1334062 [Suillus variegatus]